MTDRHDSKFLDDPEFQSLLVACLESLERGETIDRDALAKDYSKYASDVVQFLDDRHLLKQVASEFGDVEPSQVAITAYEQTMDSTSSPQDFNVGDMVRYIGEYEILEEIARGGMGVVFKARQRKLKRIVALKMILAGRLADSADVERFYREAEAAGRLKHPNIVPVHEVGEHDGRHYFTMDFVDGPSLAEELREETLEARRAAQIVQVASEAVHFAHQSGTLHRDLKPANILLTKDGVPHITDFGLAKILEAVDEDSRAELTASGQILGTPSYMSPEQASGKQQLVGVASDIYSLGAILYACLTGRAPFVADSPVDTLLQVMRHEPVSPRILNPSVPKDLDTICLKCLNKEPHQRYGTAEQLAEDLQRYLEDRPILARPADFSEKTIRWCRRNPAIATLLFLVILSMATGTIVSAYYASQANYRAKAAISAKRLAEQARENEQKMRKGAEMMTEFAMTQQSHAQLARDMAEKERDRAEQQKTRAETALTRSLYEQAKAVRLAGSEGQRWRALGLLEQAKTLRDKQVSGSDAATSDELPEEWELRSAAIATLLTQDARGVGNHASMYQAVDPQEAFVGLLEFATSRSPAIKMRIIDIPNGKTFQDLDLGLSAREFAVPSFAISPRAKILANILMTGIQLTDVNSGRTVAMLRWPQPEKDGEDYEPEYAQQVHMGFSPTGDRLIAFRSINGNGQNVIWDLPADLTLVEQGVEVDSPLELQGRLLGTTRASVFASPCFSPDGQRVAFLDSKQKVVVDSLVGNDEDVVFEIPKPMYPFGPLSFSDNGQSLALVSVSESPRQSALVVWDLKENKQHQKIMTSQNIWLTPPSLSPDGRYIAAGTPQGKITIFSLDDRKAKLSMDHGGAVRSVGWLSKDKLWSTAAGGFKQWELALEQPIREVSTKSPGHFASLRFMFSRDGSRLVTTTGSGEMHVYDWPSAEPVRSIKVPVRTTLNINLGLSGQRAIVTGIADPTGTARNSAMLGILNTTRVGFDLSTGNELFRADGKGNLSTGITDDGDILLLSREKKLLKVTEHETGSELWSKTFDLPPGIEPVARICSDGSKLAIWNSSLMLPIELSQLEVWDIVKNQLAFSIANKEDPITDVQFSGDGRKLLTLHNDQMMNGLGQSTKEANGTAVVRNAQTGDLDLAVKGSKITAAALSHNGTLVAVQFRNEHIELWNVDTGVHLFNWRLPAAERTFADSFDVAFTPDGQQLGAVVNSNGLLHFLDLKQVRDRLQSIQLEW